MAPAWHRPVSQGTTLGSMRRMAIKLENVGIAVRDLEAAIAFFTDLGLSVLGHIAIAVRDPIAMRAMRSGPVPESWARKRRPRWYEEISTPPEGAGPQ